MQVLYFNVYQDSPEAPVCYGGSHISKSRAKRVRDKDRKCIGILERRYSHG